MFRLICYQADILKYKNVKLYKYKSHASVYLNEISSPYNILYNTDVILFFVAALKIFLSVLACISLSF